MLVHVRHRACVHLARVRGRSGGGRENSASEEFTLRIKESSAGSHRRQKSPNEIFLIRSQLARLSRSLSHLSFAFFFAGGNSKLRPKYSRNVACIRDNQILKLIITSYLIYFGEEKLTLH